MIEIILDVYNWLIFLCELSPNFLCFNIPKEIINEASYLQIILL